MIKLQGVSKYYKTATGVSEGMRNINLNFKINEFVAITGQSGSGKTTLLNVISGLDSYEDGELFVNSLETSHYSVKEWEEFRAKNIGFVFQNYNVIDSYTVYQNVVIALEAQGYNESNKKERALELIERVGLTSHKHQKTSKLSGGQKQRVVIARALAKNAPIILADEPTGNLDAKSGQEIMELLKEISKDKLIILVTHNFEEAKNYVTRNIVMSDGNIKEDKLINKNPYELKETIIEETEEKSSSLKNASIIATRNVFATPKRTSFSIILLMFSVLVFTIFYAALIKNRSGVIETSGDKNAEIVANDYGYIERSKIAEIESKLNKYVKIDIAYDGYYVKEKTDQYFTQKFSSANILFDDEVTGSLPKNDNEVILNNSYGYEIGQTISLTKISKENDLNPTYQDFVIVGYTNNKFFQRHGYTNVSFLFKDSYIKNDPFYNSFQTTSIDVIATDRQEILLFKERVKNIDVRFIDDYLVYEKEMEFIDKTIAIVFWVILLFILSIIFLVLYHIFKNVMESRKKDFAVYRSIGISEKEVGLTILIEQVLIALVAVVLTTIIITILSNYINVLREITRHLVVWDYLIVSIVFAVFSIMLGLKFNKKIFNVTVIESLKEEN